MNSAKCLTNLRDVVDGLAFNMFLIGIPLSLFRALRSRLWHSSASKATSGELEKVSLACAEA